MKLSKQEKENLKFWKQEIDEVVRVENFLKSLNICQHEKIEWVSDLKRLGKCKQCEKVKTVDEFKFDWRYIYFIADKKLKSFMSHWFISSSRLFTDKEREKYFYYNLQGDISFSNSDK